MPLFQQEPVSGISCSVCIDFVYIFGIVPLQEFHKWSVTVYLRERLKRNDCKTNVGKIFAGTMQTWKRFSLVSLLLHVQNFPSDWKVKFCFISKLNRFPQQHIHQCIQLGCSRIISHIVHNGDRHHEFITIHLIVVQISLSRNKVFDSLTVSYLYDVPLTIL
jgi:hypothetical protein